MPDIQMRFHKDMLVLSSPIASTLARRGVDLTRDREYTALFEPEILGEAYRIESMAGAQCLVLDTANLTDARLAHVNMVGKANDILQAILTEVRTRRPQHIIAELGSRGLPVDASSEASLSQLSQQYQAAARLFAHEELDAVLLRGFSNLTDMTCALEAVRGVFEGSLFCSVELDGELVGGAALISRGDALVDEPTLAALVNCLSTLRDAGADVVGIESGLSAKQLAPIIAALHKRLGLPLLAELHVGEHKPRQRVALPNNPYYCADAMEEAAVLLRGAGAQFLRATGQATPAYTGVLSAMTTGLDVVYI